MCRSAALDARHPKTEPYSANFNVIKARILGCEVAGPMLGTPQSQTDADIKCAPTEALDLPHGVESGAQTAEGLTWPKQHPSPSALPGAMPRLYLNWQKMTVL